MLAKKRHPFIAVFTILMFVIVLLFDTNPIFSIRIENATPLIVLSLITAFSVFAGAYESAVWGIICGAMLDSVSLGTYCFNTILFFIIGVAANLAANNLFNKNVRAAGALAIITASIYYIARWLFIESFGMGMENSLKYILSYAFPSAVYSAIFVFPFFYIFRHFDKIKKGI